MGITILILGVEGMLLVFSVSSRRQELHVYRQEVHQVLSEVAGVSIPEERILSDSNIASKIRDYTRNIVLMVIFIIFVVISGSYLIVNQILIRPILTIYRDNMQIAETGGARSTLKIETFPKSEVGMIMHSRDTMIKVLDRAQKELLEANRKLEQQNELLLENARLREDIEQITRHDLKTPLTGIIYYPQRVISLGNLTDKQQEFLQKTTQLGYKVLNMINLSLDLYKMEKRTYDFSPVEVDLIDIIDNIIQEHRQLILAKALEVEVRINGQIAAAEDRFMAQGEELLFYSMLANLVKNALEATPKEEKISISLSDDSGTAIRISNKGSVPEEIRDSFFEKYSSSGKTGGTGLGTYSAKLIAQTMKGQIALETCNENNTTVLVSFPVKTA